MTEQERLERQEVIRIAKTWLNTPYHCNAAVKGAGVDCAMFLKAVYEEAGIVTGVTIEPYSPQWHMHRSEELFLNMVLQYADPVPEPEPGDVVLFKYGRCVSHGGIVMDWPDIIHSAIADNGTHLGVIMDNAERIRHRLYGFFSPHKWSRPQ